MDDFVGGATKTDFSDIGQAKLFFEIDGQGKPLLLLHAGIADHRMWAGQRQALSKYFQVITPDFRGYGKSPPPSKPFWHYQDVYQLSRYLGFRSVSIAGCSLGGKIALELALAYPQMVDRLILIAPGLPGYEYRDPATLAKDASLERYINSGNRESVADMLVDIWVVGLKRQREMVSASSRKLVRQMILDNYASVVDQYPEAKPEFDVMTRLGEIKVPSLVLIGDCDIPDMLEISHLVADKIPGAKRLVIPNAGHLPNLEHRSLFNHRLLSFLGT